MADLQGRIHHLESALIQRQEEISQLRAELEKERCAVEEPAKPLEDSEALIQRLRGKLADADAWILKLARDRSDLTGRNMSLARELAKTSRRCEEATAGLASTSERAKALSVAVTRLSAEKDAIEVAARARETAHEAEIGRLSDLIHYKDGVVSEAEYRAEWLLRTLSVMTGDHSKTFKGKLRSLLPAFLSRRRMRGGLKSAGLFDGENYLALHRDVAMSKIDPLRHYVNFGISEGRSIGI
jgi:DNA repair exonuclease SbcCD ATPase subunit